MKNGFENDIFDPGDRVIEKALKPRPIVNEPRLARDLGSVAIAFFRSPDHQITRSPDVKTGGISAAQPLEGGKD
jgi:hypothetical protein